jgi:serine protease Do
MAKAFDLPDDYGVVVNKVVKNSPADKAGLEEEDVVVAFDNTPVHSASELSDMVDESRIGETVMLTIYRDGDKKQVSLDIGARNKSDDEEEYEGEDDDQNWGIYMPHSGSRAYRFMDRERPYMGVSLSGLSKQLGDYFGVKNGRGALITAVEEDSPAEKAGLKAGDVIVAVNDEKVMDAPDVSQLVNDMEEGDTATVEIVRDKRDKTIKVEIGETKGPMNLGNLQWMQKNDQGLVLDLPRLKRQIPDMYRFDRNRESGDLREEMDQLKEELQQLKDELRDLRKDLR